MDWIIGLAVIGGTAGLIWLGCHYGEKWVDRTLGGRKFDPNEPIVLPHPMDTRDT